MRRPRADRVLTLASPGLASPGQVSVIVAHDIHAGEFVCQIPYFPEFEPFESFSVDKCRRLIAESIGAAGAACHTLQVLSIRRWSVCPGARILRLRANRGCACLYSVLPHVPGAGCRHVRVLCRACRVPACGVHAARWHAR